MKTKKILILSLALMILSITIVSADFWACFDKGNFIDFCNPKATDRTASNNGYSVCMKNYNEAGQCYNPGNPGKCNNNGACLDVSGGSIDSEAPQFTLISPSQDAVYTSRSTLIEFDLDEKASVYYKDNSDDKRWVRICSGCSPGTPAYSRKKSFKEGFNNLSFKAVDVVGNEIIVDRSFFIDTRKPRIHRTEPRSGYAGRFFEVQYSEDNLEKVEITFGNDETRFETIELSGCESGEKVWCDIELNLADFNNQRIAYWFNVTDKAGNTKRSQIRQNLNVDTIFPVLNNPDSFWEQGEGRFSRYIYFNFNVTEENLDKIFYSYTDSRGRLRERVLCSRLENGICKTKKAFASGHHVLDIQIRDKARNSVEKQIEFDVL